jgi:hypothetical protein
LPYKKTPPDVKSLARAYTKAAIDRLSGAVVNPPAGTPLATSIQAAQILLDRGWGRPHQTVDANLGGEIEITIRKMLGNGKDKT